MSLISTIRFMSKLAALVCFVSAFGFVIIAIAFFTFLPAMIFFLALTVLSICAGLYFRKQQEPLRGA
jgi:hypothetical protein